MKGLHSKAKKNLPNILRLLRNTEMTITKIALSNNTSVPMLRKLALENGISPDRLSDARVGRCKNRNDEIVDLALEKKYTLRALADLYSVSPQRIHQLVMARGVKIHAKNHESKRTLVEQIKKDMSTLSYEQLKSKYNIVDKHRWLTLSKLYKKKYGENLVDIMRNSRNKLIVNKYSSGEIAKKIIESDELELKSPIKISGIGYVYRISSKNGFKKFPNIISRRSGGTNEKASTIKKIAEMRESKMSFRKISEELNKLNIKTINGIKFSAENTMAKYNMYIRDLNKL